MEALWTAVIAVGAALAVAAWLLWAVIRHAKHRAPTDAADPAPSHSVRISVDRLNAAIAAFDSASGIVAQRAAFDTVLREIAAARRVIGETEGILAVAARMSEVEVLLRVEEAKARYGQQAPPDIDAERLARQKVAYGMVGKDVSAEDKAAFKRDMTEFAAVDPLVRDIATRAAQVINRHPGMLQSKIYPFFPDHDPEKVRYALYFAHEMGMLYRKKKGNTYQLFPAGSLVEGSSSRVMGDE